MQNLQVVVNLLVPVLAVAQAPEELPPPVARSVLVDRAPASGGAPTSPSGEALKQGAVENGWGLYGTNARHYFVGRVAIADYVRGGQRHIVTLIEEDPASHAKVDPNFQYYREEVAGHRWALARQAGADRRYAVYFQAADAPGAWMLFQHAQGTWDHQSAMSLPPPIYLLEPDCSE